MIFRVGIGAALSTIDAMTDIYVISTYYDAESLRGQANAMLAMLMANIIIQLLFVLAQYKKKNWKVKLREMRLTLLFLRPAVDGFRVSTNHEDKEATMNPLVEMICNKVRTFIGHNTREYDSSL